jgi:hypothetical protein
VYASIGGKTKMEIETLKIKRLILEMEPNPATSMILSMNGYGWPIILTSIPEQHSWNWNREKIMNLNDEELIKLVNHIAW